MALPDGLTKTMVVFEPTLSRIVAERGYYSQLGHRACPFLRRTEIQQAFLERSPPNTPRYFGSLLSHATQKSPPCLCPNAVVRSSIDDGVV